MPLDHDEPDGATTTLALMRRLADDRARRIGSLFVNPGGPGASGIGLVPFLDAVYPREVLERFDVVGFDPRGIGESDGLVCFDTYEELFEFYRYLPTLPVTPVEERQTAAALAGLAQRCAERDEPVLQHMSTGDVARDLDLLRQAVGDERLTYAGYSYGSQIGTTYANLFPDRVRAVVLDGVLDPVAWTTGVRYRPGGTGADWARRSALPMTARLGSAEGAWATLQQFFALCRQAGTERCALADDPRGRFERLAARLHERPGELPLGGGRFQRVGYGELVAVTLGALYDPAAWSDYADLVVEVERFGDPAAAGRAYRDLADRLGLDVPEEPGNGQPGEEPPTEEPVFQTFEGAEGVVCSDSDNPRSPRWWSWAARETDRRAPYFGRAWTWLSVACASWPARAVEDRYAGPWDARTANPVLLVGNTYDPATPYSGARTVSRLLPDSRLLTLQGWGHVALGQSACIDTAVAAYLLEGDLPAAGTVCRPDVLPFADPEEAAPGEGAAARTAQSTGAEDADRAAARRAVLRSVPLPR